MSVHLRMTAEVVEVLIANRMPSQRWSGLIGAACYVSSQTRTTRIHEQITRIYGKN